LKEKKDEEQKLKEEKKEGEEGSKPGEGADDADSLALTDELELEIKPDEKDLDDKEEEAGAAQVRQC